VRTTTRFWTAASLLAIAGIAAAQPKPQRKSATDAYSSEALEAFVDAIVADKAGDLEGAHRHYETSSHRSPQANTMFNLADVELRMEQLDKAIASFRKYLELAPDAPDRKQVERWIDQLSRTPGTAVIDGDEPDAIVLVDGKLIGPSPVVIHLPDGKHTADRISPTNYRHATFEVKAATTIHPGMSHSSDNGGNVILSSSPVGYGGSWHDGDVTYALPGWLTLDPGHHETFLMTPKRACRPIAFDAPPAGELVFVYLDIGTPAQRGDCLPITIRQQPIRFPP
jgi:tetratricopeptide (TPR) repeat protein